ncbi:NAD(P)/FAD-dependent oxidoreductase, partial [Nocardia abscessus]|uniref:NAD(P)/FAD-dependent oxidoreductase n=1 Tax=Nocardia abscessus TaxID=120957 RepID=UPI002458F388
ACQDRRSDSSRRWSGGGTTGSKAATPVVYMGGGANSAGQAAVFLSRNARTVHLLVRADSLEQSMSHYLIQQIAQIGNIQVHTNTEVVAADGADHLQQIVLRDNRTGAEEKADAERLFLFIGAAPQTEWLDGVVTRDDAGYVLAGPDLLVDGARPAGWELSRPPHHLETSVPGVFVAGDVHAESAKRVASAVGEGAMAVMLVHRYLA